MKKTLLLYLAIIIATALVLTYACQKEVIESSTSSIMTMLMQTPPADNNITARKSKVAAKTIAELDVRMYNNYYYSYGKDTALSCVFTSDSAFSLNFNNGVNSVVVKGTNVYGSGACCGYAGKYYASMVVFNNQSYSYAYYDNKINSVPFRRYQTWSVNIVGDGLIQVITFVPNVTYNY